MRKLLLLIVISTIGYKSFAQAPSLGNFSAGIDGAVPIKEERQIFNVAAGGYVQFDYGVVKHLYVNLTAGFESFSTIKRLESVNVTSNYDYVPVRAGLRYYAIAGLFVQAQVGVSYYTWHGGGKGFDASPGIGYSFPKGFEFGARFEQWNQNPESHIPGEVGQSGPFSSRHKFGQLAIRLAERF